MTKEEVEKMLLGTQKIQELLTKGVDLTDISFDPNFMSALTGDLFQSETKKIVEEVDKYEKMKIDFLETANAKINSLAKFPKIQNFEIKNMKNYYILSCSEIIEYYSNDYYGSFFGIFDKKGNLVSVTEFKDEISFADEHNYFIESFIDSHICSYCHKRLEEGHWKTLSEFESCIRMEQINSNSPLMKLYQVYSPYGTIDDQDINIYNKKTGQIILSGISAVSSEYKEWKNFEPGKFYFISKVITEVENKATLNFFVDLEGNLVSDVFDLERSKIYHVDISQNQNESLERIYDEVKLSLEKENEEKQRQEQARKNIYELKYKQKEN